MSGLEEFIYYLYTIHVFLVSLPLSSYTASATSPPTHTHTHTNIHTHYNLWLINLDVFSALFPRKELSKIGQTETGWKGIQAWWSQATPPFSEGLLTELFPDRTTPKILQSLAL